MVAPEFLPVWGGVGTYVVELVRHLPEDIEVHVVTPMRESFGKEKVSTYDYDFSKYFGGNVYVHLVSKASDTFMYNADFQFACLKHVPKLIKKEHIDLIHYASHIAGLMLEFKKLNIPTVTTIHTTIGGQRHGTRMSGMNFKDLEFSEKATYLAYPFLRLGEIIYFLRPRYYITVSKWMKCQLRRQNMIRDSSVFVIHNSVDTKLFSPYMKRKPPKGNLILFTGRIIAAKGIKYLVEAIPKVLREYPDTFFMFIGAGDSSPYRRQLKAMGISKRNFAFLGYLKERSELIKYYRASSVYVAPTFYENLPIRVLEAMACGVPVVASNVCAVPEAIDNCVNGILIPPGSTDDLVDAICWLLSDSNLRRKMGNNARKTILEKFDWNLNVIRTVEVYKKILNGFKL